MKRILTMSIIFVLISASLFLIKAEITENETIYVDDDNTTGPWDGSLLHPYRHIQQAINNASDEDTIFIRNGVYDQVINVGIISSSVARIYKPLTIIGEDRDSTIIDGKGNTMFDIWSTPITIRNLTFYNGTSKNTFNGDGICKNNHENNYEFTQIIIDNCVFIDNNEGIHMGYSSNNVSNVRITNCEFINHRQHSICISGTNESYNLENVIISNCTIQQSNNTGIMIDRILFTTSENSLFPRTKNITISNCSIKESFFGLILSSAGWIPEQQKKQNYKNERLSIENQSNDTHLYDVHYSTEFPLYNKEFTELKGNNPIPAMEHITIENNKITYNELCGVSLGGFFSDCILQNNKISNTYSDNMDNLCNILLESQGTTITHNDISDTYLGFIIIEGRQNEISSNNFINNTYPGYIFSAIPDISVNSWIENYYDDHNGYGPKIIPGRIDKIGSKLISFKIPFCNIDWQPAKEPYDIDI